MSAWVGTLIFIGGVASGVWRSRALFALFLVSGALFLPLREGLIVDVAACDMGVGPNLMRSVFNAPHIFLFAVLSAIASRQRHQDGRPLFGGWRLAALVLGFGAVLELEQALFSAGHCRLRDLLPDALGLGLVLGGAALLRTVRGRRTASC